MVAVKNAEKRHTIKSWVSLCLSILIIIAVFIAVVENLLAKPTELVQEVGVKTFRMYTVLSNMLVSITAALSIPFAVDGIRNRNYHLPRWIVNLTFVAVSVIFLTFSVSLCILSPYAGFYVIMLEKGNIFLHTLVPLTSIILFMFINNYHNVKFKMCFVALIPVFTYAVVYLISVIVIGENNGGWRDHYHFQEFLPWPVVALLLLSVAFGMAVVIRLVHNHTHKIDKMLIEKHYQENEKYDLEKIEEVIINMARENKQYDQRGEVTVPRRVIIMLEKKYNSGKPLSELCKLYIDEYLK